MTAVANRRRCAIYTRKSTDEGLEQSFNSLDAQREACEAYVFSQSGEGWDRIPDRYDDGGWSGGNMERPALKQLLADIAKGRIDIVVVYKVDRLTRSLMDFARIVETFDKNGISFVSVTQAFNTTTSMGRLTLNVLLSFAQFEREVTGERIRDKIAASRAKGIFMGGNVALGYDLGDRRLEVNEAEAETVRQMFRRYLELKSLPALTRELAGQGILSKRWTSRAGLVHGGLTISCGGLAHILRNRIYRGEAVHKGKAHRGEHEAIVPDDLFDAVQQRLDDNRVRHRTRKTRAASSPLTGKIHDADGQPMRVSFSYGRGSRMYRYYVSESLTPNGQIAKGGNLSGVRFSATRIERVLETALRPVLTGADPATALFDAVAKVTAAHGRLFVELDPGRLIADGTQADLLLARAQSIDPGASIIDARLKMIVELPPERRGRSVRSPDTAMLGSDRKGELAALVRTAHRRLGELNASPMHPESHCDMKAPASEWIRRRMAIGLLAPDIQKALFSGTAPDHVSAEWLLDADLPLDWEEQRRFVRLSVG